LESWLQRKDDRGNYTDGGRKREIIEQLKKQKFIERGFVCRHIIQGGVSDG
jgi:hypothetical protein